MPKRLLDSATEDTHFFKRQRLLRPDHLSCLSDELILRVLSYLSVPELNLCQRLSIKFRAITADSQLWKAHYYKRFVRPRASRIPGIRTNDGFVPSVHLHFSSKLSKWLDEQSLVKGGVKTDWKRQYKLRHNWSRGACHVSKIELAEQPPIAPLHLRLHESTVYSVDRNGGLRAWSLKDKKRLVARKELSLDSTAPTCLAVDAQADGEDMPQMVVGFENGSFRVFRPKAKDGGFKETYAHAASSNGTLIAVAFFFPYLLTMTTGQLLSLYKFPEESHSRRANRILDPPRILQSLRSHTVSQPVSLSIRANTTGITASIAYAVSSISTLSWSVGLQEMRLTTEGKLTESRLATSAASNSSWDPLRSDNGEQADQDPGTGLFQRPLSLSYNHPYLLVSHADNTLTLYLVISDQRTLSIGPGKRLWGHTSAVSAAHVGGRGRAVSVSQKGGELRVWELERTLGSRQDERTTLRHRLSVLIRPEHLDTHEDSKNEKGLSGMAKITEAIRRRGNGLGLAPDERFDEQAPSRSLVGFDEENVVLLSERRGLSQALMVYDFT